jgi:molecular chaperone DnaK (HSP70)
MYASDSVLFKEIDYTTLKVLRVASRLAGYLAEIFKQKMAERNQLSSVQKDYAQVEEESQLLKQVLSSNKTLDINVYQTLKPALQV